MAYSRLAFLEARVGRGAAVDGAVRRCLGRGDRGAGAGAGAAEHHRDASPVHDAAVVLCIDTSGSMASTDVAPTRSEASRGGREAFIDGVPDGTRIGLVASAPRRFRSGPLTDDRDAAREALAALPAPNGGTAIGDALETAAQLLPPAGRRAIVLVTDGVNNARQPTRSGGGATIGAHGISIFTIGIGTNGSGQLIPGTGEDAELDEDALREIARDRERHVRPRRRRRGAARALGRVWRKPACANGGAST